MCRPDDDGSVYLAGYGDELSSHWLQLARRADHPPGAETRTPTPRLQEPRRGVGMAGLGAVGLPGCRALTCSSLCEMLLSPFALAGPRLVVLHFHSP